MRNSLTLLSAIVTIAQGEAPPFMSQQVVPNLSVALSVVIALGAVFAYFLLFSGRVTAELAADDFKSINDKWGHHAGDVALKAIAHGIRLKVRQYDLVARLGGDEFVVLLPGLGKTAVAELAPRLMESIPKQRTDHPGGVNVSIGVSCLEPTPESVATPSAGVGHADAADEDRRRRHVRREELAFLSGWLRPRPCEGLCCVDQRFKYMARHV